MKDVFEFFLSYYQVIFLGISCVVSLAVLIVSIVKGNKSLAPILSVLIKLPQLIKDAEEHGGTGVNKYSIVFASAIKLLCALSKESEKKIISKYGFLIDSSIEDILSTPTKKGK